MGKPVPLETLLFRNILSVTRGTKSERFSYLKLLTKPSKEAYLTDSEIEKNAYLESIGLCFLEALVLLQDVFVYILSST